MHMAMKDYLEKEQNDRPKGLSSSSITGCIKKDAYGFEYGSTKGVSDDAQSIRTLFISTLAHEKIQEHLPREYRGSKLVVEKRMSVDIHGHSFSGKPDLLVYTKLGPKQKLAVIDWKFVGTWSFKYQENQTHMKSQYLRQLRIYSEIAYINAKEQKITFGPLADLILVIFDLGTRKIKSFKENHRPAQYTELSRLEQIIKNKKLLMKTRKGGHPLVPSEEWECKYCPFQKKCIK